MRCSSTSRSRRCAPPASPCRSSSTTCWATCPRPSSSARRPSGRAACRRRCCSRWWPWRPRERSTSAACARWGATPPACRRRSPRGRRDMRRILTAAIEALFRVLFTYGCLGEENVPAEGPAVVAANHPSYLDPILLSLQVRRPIYFMAWDALFRVPLLGALMRVFGAFPVDVRPGKGREAYAKAKALVESGEVVGLFPEGHRSPSGWMEPRLREGAARLAWETGAPLVPATIAGAFRAWPRFAALPRPARIRVRYHEPIDPVAYRGLPEEEALPALLAELHRRVDRTLQPGVKADLRMTVLYASPPPPPRVHEVAAAILVAAVMVARTHSAFALVPSLVYLAYLALDRTVV